MKIDLSAVFAGELCVFFLLYTCFCILMPADFCRHISSLIRSLGDLPWTLDNPLQQEL